MTLATCPSILHSEAALAIFRASISRITAFFLSRSIPAACSQSAVVLNIISQEIASPFRYPLGRFYSFPIAPQTTSAPSEIASLNISGFPNIVYHKGNPVDFLSVSKSNSTENFFATVFRNLLEPYRSIFRGPNICNKDSLIKPGETTPKALTTYPKSLEVYISNRMSSGHYEDIPSPPSRLLSSIALTI